MVNIRKKNIKAYILLESLLALAVLAMISSLILGQINHNRSRMAASLKRQEVLSVASMALQTGQSEVELDGIKVSIHRDDSSLRVLHQAKEVLALVKK